MNNKNQSPVEGWIPIKLYAEDDKLLCRWLYVGDKDFKEPFFDETISACRVLPENGHLKRSMSSTDVLVDWEKEFEVIEPTAFIFHISRCGSTLISQMLGLQPCNIVLSEVPFFDDLLRFGKKQNRMSEILPQLKAAIGFYGAKRNENHQHLFIKTDSWHIHFYKELRALYPAVPFFLLYRKPDEVIRSQQKKRGMQAIPGLIEPELFGFKKEDLFDQDGSLKYNLDDYMAKVLETYLQAFHNILQTDKLSFAINYHEEAMTIIDTIASVTQLPISEVESAAMLQRSRFHAKFPDQVFTEEQVPEPVPAFLQKSVDLYHKLEQLRLSRI